MKYLLLALASLLSFEIHALEYEIQLENDAVNVSHAKIMPLGYEYMGTKTNSLF